jgi:hypothetical protein
MQHFQAAELEFDQWGKSQGAQVARPRQAQQIGMDLPLIGLNFGEPRRQA